MATSGSVDYTLTAEQLLDQAFSKIGVKKAEQALQADEIQDGLNVLNAFLKFLQSKMLHLWTKEEGVIFLDKGKTDYLLGPSGDEATDLDDFVSTTTTSALIATDVVVPVVSTAGMTTGDKAGVQLDDGTRHWTTLTVDSAVQVTLASGVASAGASGNSLFTFTSLIERPLRITGVRRATFGEDSEIEVTKFSRFDYFNQSNKTGQGTVVNYYYSPQLTNGRFYVWQTADSINDFVRITYQRAIEDIDDKTNNIDIPAEWMETVIYNVAGRLTDDYDAPAAKIQSVNLRAEALLDDLLGWDEEDSSLEIEPDFS